MPSTAINAQGSILQIGTGSGGAKTITAASVGNPTVFTSAAHGLALGDYGPIAALVGTISAVNGASYTVTHKTTNTFAVAYDSTGLAYTSGGTFTPTTYTACANIKSFSGFDGQGSDIDVTNLASAAKEFRIGLIDNGMLSLDMHLDRADAGQLAMQAAQVGSLLKAFKLILPSGSTPNASFNAYVKKFALQGAVDGVVGLSVDLKISGAVTWS
jgi:hypothetical protein